MTLRRFLEPRPLSPIRPKARTGERCELCAEPISEDHAHIVNLENRSLLCTCRACYLLFTPDGAGGGKYRAIPREYRHAHGFALSQAQWDRLQIPVSIAFFFFNTSLGRIAAFYPSPAGATESELALETWNEVVREHPFLADLLPDVEALLVRKRGDDFEAFVVPIDACYELVGRVRRHWKGFDGGEEAWSDIDVFFAEVQAKSVDSASTMKEGV